MEEIQEENLIMRHALAIMQRMTSMQEEYLNNMRRMYMNAILWNDLAVTMAETGFNAALSRSARWSDAASTIKKNISETFQPQKNTNAK